MKIIAFLLFYFCTLVPLAEAITATVGENTGNTYSGTNNRMLKQNNPTTGYSSVLEVTHYGAGDYSNTAIKLDVSGITGPVTVTSATLFLYHDSGNNGSNVTIEARRLLRNWVEAQTTWNEYTTGNAWTTGGAMSNGNDRIGTASGTGTVPTTTGAYVSITGANMATDVQNWINGINSNYGWIVERQDVGEDSVFSQFVSTQGADSQRPYLEIIYTTGLATATPRRRAIFVQ